jgi:ATP-dependent exoDNAse (exonuclease V) beta subunit
MRAFVKLRQLMESNKNLAKKIAALESKYDGQFQIVFEAIKQLMQEDNKHKDRIGF